jgi:hypothetical protein
LRPLKNRSPVPARLFIETQEPRVGCKIGRAKNIDWANSSILKTIGPDAPAFDVGLIAEQSIEFSASFDQAIVDFDARLKKALVPALGWFAKTDPAQFIGYSVIRIGPL